MISWAYLVIAEAGGRVGFLRPPRAHRDKSPLRPLLSRPARCRLSRRSRRRTRTDAGVPGMGELSRALEARLEAVQAGLRRTTHASARECRGTYVSSCHWSPHWRRVGRYRESDPAISPGGTPCQSANEQSALAAARAAGIQSRDELANAVTINGGTNGLADRHNRFACLTKQSGSERMDRVMLSIQNDCSHASENVFIVQGDVNDPASASLT